MSESTTPALGDMDFVDPHLSLDHPWVPIPAPSPIPIPGQSSGLALDIAGNGRSHDLPAWLEATHATSLVVLLEGRVRHEWYADGVGPGSLLLGASATKSVLAHLVGVAVQRGELRLDDLVVDHVPELAGSGYADCRVEHVITMTSGVDWVEDHRDPDGPARRLVGCFGPGGGDSRALLTAIAPADEPGTRFEYCTADSQVLDWVRERATGHSAVDALGVLWSETGAEHEARMIVDGPGVALAGGGLAASARDWARVGLLAWHGTGRSGSLLDDAWLSVAGRPDRSFLVPGRLPGSISSHVGFARHWWPLDRTGVRLAADGSRGQFVFVDRSTGVVIVKTSRWPHADPLLDRTCRDLSYLGLQDIARAVTATENQEPS